MKNNETLRLTSKNVRSETIERVRVDIPENATHEEVAHLKREITLWYNHENLIPSASEAIEEFMDDPEWYFFYEVSRRSVGNDLNREAFNQVLDTEALTRL